MLDFMNIKFYLVAAGLTIMLLVSSANPARALSDLLPNLEALPAKQIQLQSDGTKTYLRFSTTTWNSGLAALILVAGEKDTGQQKVYQRIQQDDGNTYDRLAGTFVWHPEHSHFHMENYATYILQLADAPGASSLIGNKTTFCVMDTDRINRKLPGAPKKRVFINCGDQLQGMSVGYGDTYRYYLAGQEIDVTGLPDGDYNLTQVVDPKNRLLETNEEDNTSNVVLRINLTDGTVEVLEDGNDHPGKGNCPHC